MVFGFIRRGISSLLELIVDVLFAYKAPKIEGAAGYGYGSGWNQMHQQGTIFSGSFFDQKQ
jgi:hypothetical protein